MKHLAMLSALLMLLGGCSDKKPVPPATDTVRIYFKQFPTENCTYLGEVIGSNGNMFTFLFIANEVLMKNALADLKANTALKGGNAVYLMEDQLSFASSVTLLGQAYSCH